ncbi:unnamed protein product [Dovyalis caffra]|uniref:Uncharacterized protein n=1 Tax=Dovyalis caffra TaxID=77055 RepID=A0AAV1R9W8_9ROSI|nr:unnamed protein product [Dovyalis caffra]
MDISQVHKMEIDGSETLELVCLSIKVCLGLGLNSNFFVIGCKKTLSDVETMQAAGVCALFFVRQYPEDE